MKKLIAGNWKMNGSNGENKQLLSGIAQLLEQIPAIHKHCEMLVCPPSVYLSDVTNATKGTGIETGAQDCSHHSNGAYTGDIAATMIRDTGASYVILGHSERRQYHDETSTMVSWKASSAHEAGLKAIICVGEKEHEREQGIECEIVKEQLLDSLPDSANADNTIIAYEPVWAIGTGKTASKDDVASMHSFIRDTLKNNIASGENIRILYGGSMKPENAGELLATENVDGGLIGGASLKADHFIAIAKAAI